MFDDQAMSTMRELDSRTGDGLHVRLLWNEDDGRVAITVEDRKTGESFAVEVHHGDSAMQAFHHPFAYAAWRGASTSTPVARSGSASPATTT